jgi:glycyl-tRNA synthetase beta chain
MTDFLLELLSEEIPARMQEKACADLQRLFEGEIAKAGLKAGAIETYATPRRLALIARDLPAATEAVREETKGPRAGAPPQALEGFLRKTGLTADRLTERDGVLFAVVEKPGRATAEVLAETIPAVIRAFPWPKSMRWGAASQTTASLRWVRPLQGIVALFGEMIVPFEIEGLASGAITVGHRFHHPGPITIGSAADYAEKLRMCHVIVDAAERRGIIEGAARALAETEGLHLVADAGLVAENAGLTEWPVPLLGRFDPAFLEVPREVIQLTLRTNQKYFVLADGEGRLAPNFICTANIEATDGGVAIVAGNRKVLAARLSDARFFWEQDLRVPLAEQAKKLSQIVFHEELGTVADKVERVAKLARWLVEEGIVGPQEPSPQRGEGWVRGSDGAAGASPPSSAGHPHPTLSLKEEGSDAARMSLADMAETAARLCKADLVTGMVGEFPELQGVMGGYYARHQGFDPQIADAIRDHYKPVGQGDDVPTASVTVAVSLADKLDTIAAFFLIDQKPTGSKDPFALRRSALGILAIILINGLRGEVTQWLAEARQECLAQGVQDTRKLEPDTSTVRSTLKDVWAHVFMNEVRDFISDRLKVQQREAGVRHDLIDAVFALGGEDDLVRLLARVKALQAFVGTQDGTDLLAGYKRAANILAAEAKKDGEAIESLTSANQYGYELQTEESALISALESAEPLAEAAIAGEDFEGAMRTLSGLRGPVYAFLDHVRVDDADPAKRRARLGLLARVRDAVNRVADFSKIAG